MISDDTPRDRDLSSSGEIRAPWRGPGTARSPRWDAERVERDVRALVLTGDAQGAASAALRAHGAEVFGFLLGVLGGSGQARDAYAAVGLEVRGRMDGFRWRCALRVWMYALACAEIRRVPGAGGERGSVTLPEPSSTQPCRPVGLGQAIAALRDSLSAEDRALLILRVDRCLSLSDIAYTRLGEGAAPGEIAREAARLRERIRIVRETLARAAVERHLLDPR
jgi:DNA-directed RNA polymerase specialized sigma24 family protein